jgi:uncharacterized protein
MSSQPLPIMADPVPTPFRDGPGTASSSALLRAHVFDLGFPCVGAKSAVAKGQLSVVGCGRIDRATDDPRIHGELAGFAADCDPDRGQFRSLAIVFAGPLDLTEAAFEQKLWERVQSLADIDRRHGFAHDARVNSDPASPEFALAFGGQALYLVGLHPHASRPARRFARPSLVFNLHSLFERLRADGRLEPMRETIMQRDEALAGSCNPMLERHGEASAARQYSGRIVAADWRCPFRPGDAA